MVSDDSRVRVEHAWPPAPADCRPDGMKVDLGDGNRLVLDLTYFQARLAGFALIHQTEAGPGRWVDVIKVDTKHDEVHAHRYDTEGREFDRRVIRPIEGFADVDTGYTDAYCLVTERIGENLRRWARGR